MWVQKGGRAAPKEALAVAETAAAELQVPAGILLATCECETNFRLGLVSKDGAVGPVQFLPKYEADYYRYAGFKFDLYDWDALRGLAGVYKTYAKWGADRHGLRGDDCWRFAVSAHRYGQNSKTCLDMQNKRVRDVEEHMRRNNVWYDAPAGDTDAAARVYAATGKAAADWALTKLGYKYSQAQRESAKAFDCSSLVARAYAAVGVSMEGGGLKKAPTANLEVYSDQFELIWPETYDKIGKVYGGRSVLDKARQPGDLQFINTQKNTLRANRITHVTMICDRDHIVHARGKAYGVVRTEYTLYSGKICAVARFNPDGPLRKGMRGKRVEELQRQLNAMGARLTVDGQYGKKTEEAAKRYGMA